MYRISECSTDYDKCPLRGTGEGPGGSNVITRVSLLSPQSLYCHHSLSTVTIVSLLSPPVSLLSPPEACYAPCTPVHAPGITGHTDASLSGESGFARLKRHLCHHTEGPPQAPLQRTTQCQDIIVRLSLVCPQRNSAVVQANWNGWWGSCSCWLRNSTKRLFIIVKLIIPRLRAILNPIRISSPL